MKSKENVRDFWDRIPAPKAHTVSRHSASLSNGARKILALSFVVTGALCLLFTDWVHDALPYILGCVMAVKGIIDTARGFLTKEHAKRETKLTANGIVFFVLGIVILIHRANVDNLIGAIWGTLGLLKGSEELNEAIYCCAHKERFVGKMIRAAIELLLGFLLLIDPISNMHHHLFILGLELITAGWEMWGEAKHR